MGRCTTTHAKLVAPREPSVQYRVTEDGRWQRAFDKAREVPHNTWIVTPTLYKVHSASEGDVWHFVRKGGETWLCDCRAAEYGNPCWHVAALYMRLAREFKAIRLDNVQPTPWDLFEEEVPEECEVVPPCLHGTGRR